APGRLVQLAAAAAADRCADAGGAGRQAAPPSRGRLPPGRRGRPLSRARGGLSMCGLAGYLGSAPAGEDARALLGRMIGTLAHRGPDGFGVHLDQGVGLAHARLSIIDLATGDQPMSSPDRTVWTVFNGEIFNFIELRAELESQGHVFRTRSD